ncbi:FkbM family methyltransferase [Sphingomonas sp. NFR15]|uniref:FkbM family methyltransferase n=1 Tax=Sphingomonas sp. NFR15 TaxID=1566282 RepID=UPI000882F27A|nr:FkbM family methyltransferase [Sphingomonas sp. NFR15]SDA36900.1 methyltransferase, FkbM family [Sphingomonas sp. NFR15]
MGIISYAQNFEDVILWRALGHIANGTYLDIGAHHPDIDSVSKAFHDHGWHGVHVEPGPEVAKLLRDKRPGDLVVQAIVSNETGVKPFYETPGGGLSTADREVANFHLEQHHAPVTDTVVVSITLDDLLDQVPGDDIHWMKIDVEGFERKVLLSWQTSPRRPWVIVVEAIYPKTRNPTHGGWEDIVLSKGYSFVYDDGLNRFYLSDSHAELREKLIHPPNIFDEFQINPSGGSVFSQDMKAFMENEVHARDERIADLEAECGRVRAEAGREVARVEEELDRVRREAAQERSLHAHLGASWKEANSRAENLVLRLVEREATIAVQSQRLAQVDSDIAQMKSAFDQFRLRDACTRSLVARSIMDRSLPWPLRMRRGSGRGTALGSLLALPDADFVDGAYRAIFGREADPHGKQHYLARLAAGRRRDWLLENLASSVEARDRASGSDLAELADEDFVDAAYWRALGRAPDSDGKAHYVERLRGGLTRPDLLKVLRDSVEGRAYDQGIRQEIDDLLHRRRSLLGWRTWLHPYPSPPLFDAPGHVMRTCPECGSVAKAGQPANAATTAVTIDPADMRHLKDKVVLLAAAIEGIGSR